MSFKKSKTNNTIFRNFNEFLAKLTKFRAFGEETGGRKPLGQKNSSTQWKRPSEFNTAKSTSFKNWDQTEAIPIELDGLSTAKSAQYRKFSEVVNPMRGTQ